MPIRYFLAMCFATLVLTALFLISVPSDVALWSSADEESQAVPGPTVITSPSLTVKVEAPKAEPITIPPPTPGENVSVSTFPADRGGAEVARVVAPELMALPGVESLVNLRVSGLATRELPTSVASPEPLRKRFEFRPPPLELKSAGRPTLPAERLPADLSGWSGGHALRPVFAAGPPVSEKARDPGELPRLPVLARPPSVKASLEDPLAEVGNEALVNRPSIVVLVTATFVRLGLPDPFAYAEQVRIKLDPASEPGQTPVPVNPRRSK